VGDDIPPAQRVSALPVRPGSSGLARLLDVAPLTHELASIGDLTTMLPMGFFPRDRWSRPVGDPTTWVPPSRYRKPHLIMPMRLAPYSEPQGGLLFLDDALDEDRLRACLLALGLRGADQRDYFAIMAESADPSTDGYLVQLRIVHRQACRTFGIADGDAPEQDVTVVQALSAFVIDQQAARRRAEGVWALPISGIDEDDALGRLGFGIAVENGQWHVLRMWSRIWGVMK
jgi:hypothetical protein